MTTIDPDELQDLIDSGIAPEEAAEILAKGIPEIPNEIKVPDKGRQLAGQPADEADTSVLNDISKYDEILLKDGKPDTREHKIDEEQLAYWDKTPALQAVDERTFASRASEWTRGSDVRRRHG